VFSSASSEYDSDGEVLPLVSTHQDGRVSPGGHLPRAQNGGAAGEGAGAAVGENGKWFQALDERYLLPLFLNATGSRTFHARCALGWSTHNLSTSGSGAEGSAGLSVAGSDNEADVAGVKTRTQWSWGCHSSNGCQGTQGRGPGISIFSQRRAG
jgi:sodium/hydrogen exchanger-like protein 6/7